MLYCSVAKWTLVPRPFYIRPVFDDDLIMGSLREA